MPRQANKRLRRKLGLEVNRDKLPAYAWSGGYAILYHCADGGTLCAKCVNDNIGLIDVAQRDHDAQWNVIATFIHWEGEPLQCDNCEVNLASEYGIPESETNS